jgi:membrane protease YdiL (CAAX protease family)
MIHVVFFDGVVTPDVLPDVIEYPLFLGVVILFGGGLEEPGWREYLLPALQETYSPLTAGLLVGVVWAGWHLPLVFIPVTIRNTLPLGLYLLQLVELSILLTWLTNRTDGSVLPAILLHAGGNVLLNYYPSGGLRVRRHPSDSDFWSRHSPSPSSHSSSSLADRLALTVRPANVFVGGGRRLHIWQRQT